MQNPNAKDPNAKAKEQLKVTVTNQPKVIRPRMVQVAKAQAQVQVANRRAAAGAAWPREVYASTDKRENIPPPPPLERIPPEELRQLRRPRLTEHGQQVQRDREAMLERQSIQLLENRAGHGWHPKDPVTHDRDWDGTPLVEQDVSEVHPAELSVIDTWMTRWLRQRLAETRGAQRELVKEEARAPARSQRRMREIDCSEKEVFTILKIMDKVQGRHVARLRTPSDKLVAEFKEEERRDKIMKELMASKPLAQGH